ncbi:MarR family transcriptional regulator [Natrarchaeobius chitinivorans]|nr:MarR family transcriptional regulator [Natrarchaeobius chitinivorans]
MSHTDTRPRAVIHQKILDQAASQPNASVEDLVANVSGATPELVQRVLSEYGDASYVESAAESDESDSRSPSEAEMPIDPDSLSEIQFETLRKINEYPSATQRELADLLEITAATVSKRVNTIEGFEWDDRQRIAAAVVANRETKPDGGTPIDSRPQESSGSSDETVTEPQPVEGESIASLFDRLDRLENKLDSWSDQSGVEIDDPALLHKVIHACMESDSITEDEELYLLQILLA